MQGWKAPTAGPVAVVAALGCSELLSGLIEPVPSLVLGVAGLFIDETPGGLVRWSIETFGAGQKTLLVVGIIAVCVPSGALLGLAQRRRPPLGIVGFAALGTFGAWASTRDSLTNDAYALLTAGASTAVGVGVLTVLTRTRALGMSSGVDGSAVDTIHHSGQIGAHERRRFLAAAGAIAVLGAASGEIGRMLRSKRSIELSRDRLAATLGTALRAGVPAEVVTFDSEVAGLSTLVTPNDDFYRIDTRILVPQVNPDDWTLRITGMVEREVTLSFDDLVAMERITEYVTLQCVSNEVGGDLVGTALWSGIPLTELLDLAIPHPRASQIVGRSVDGWTAGFPTDVVTDGRPCMVALTMNGEPLPVKHGFPARLVVPGLYGYVSATKWLTEIELTTWEAFDGYWIPRGWAKEGTIRTQSRIDVPRRGTKVKAGRWPVAGVAWAPGRAIRRVEVRVDDGPWHEAELSGSLSVNTWVQWLWTWDATPGTHRLQVRATDGTGETQTAEVAPPAPSGATGLHTVTVDVR